jgi:hypothetical protein
MRSVPHEFPELDGTKFHDLAIFGRGGVVGVDVWKERCDS